MFNDGCDLCPSEIEAKKTDQKFKGNLKLILKKIIT